MAKYKFKKIVRKYGGYFAVIAIMVLCSAYVNQYFGFIPNPSIGQGKGQGEWTRWCVFACESAVFKEYSMCYYATQYVRDKTKLDTVMCCVNGEDPVEYAPIVPRECNCGVLMKELNWVFNQASNKGPILYHGRMKSLDLTEELKALSFPCFGMFDDNLNHCVVICGVQFETSVYGKVWFVYYWDPWGDGYYDYTTLMNNSSGDMYVWSAIP